MQLAAVGGRGPGGKRPRIRRHEPVRRPRGHHAVRCRLLPRRSSAALFFSDRRRSRQGPCFGESQIYINLFSRFYCYQNHCFLFSPLSVFLSVFAFLVNLLRLTKKILTIFIF